MKLYPFQEAILAKLEKEQHVTIEFGCGKSIILMEYAKRHPDAKILLCISPALAVHYHSLMVKMKVTNVTLVS